MQRPSAGSSSPIVLLWASVVILAIFGGVSSEAAEKSSTLWLPLPSESAPARLQIEALRVIGRLIMQGHAQVAGVDLMNLKRDILGLVVENDLSSPIPLTSGERRTAYYFPSERKIVVRDLIVSLPPVPETVEAVETLGLHESLGALGYEDSNYQLSLQMNFLSRHPTGKINSILSKVPAINVTSGAKSGGPGGDGGSTSVGGGGDLTALRIKYETIGVLIQKFEVDSAFVHRILNMSFEPNVLVTDRRVHFVEGDCTTFGTRSFTVRLPVNGFIERTGAERQKMVDGIAKALAERFLQ